MEIGIRKASTADAEELSALVLGLADYFLSNPEDPKADPFLATLTPSAFIERIQSGEYHHYVTSDDMGICGLIAMRNRTHLYHLFVHPRAHGQGVARALWEFAQAKFEAGVYTVNSSTFAVPVYERLGFKAVKEPQTVDGLTFVPMELRK